MHGTYTETVVRYILQQPGCAEENHEKHAQVVGLWADIWMWEFSEYAAAGRSVGRRHIGYCAQCYQDNETEGKIDAECMRYW